MTSLKRCKVVFNIGDEYVMQVREMGISNIFKRGQIEANTLGEKEYIFATDIQDLQRGDRVVVNARDSYALATFIRYTGETVKQGMDIKQVVDRVEFENFYNRMELERRKEELKAKMEERKQGLEELTIYRMLAESDKEMQEMLKEYIEMNGGEI